LNEEAMDQILKASYEYIYAFEVLDDEVMPLGYDDKKWDEYCDKIICDYKMAIRLWAEIMMYADRVVSC